MKSPPNTDERWLIEGTQWLVGAAAATWLRECPAHQVTPAVVARLRRHLSLEQCRLITQQLQLRHRARQKFAQADRLFFDGPGLEQSTDECIARYKAESIPAAARMADLCCGIGGDAMALAARGPIDAVDWNPCKAILAEANLQQLGFSESAHVLCQDTRGICLRGYDGWHADPDRRQANRRTIQPDQMQPAADVWREWLVANPNAMIKLAPACRPGHPDFPDAEWEWIGHRRQCQQLVLRWGALARYPGRRVATVVDEDDGSHECVVEGAEGAGVTVTDHADDYLWEPQPAVIAAGLADQVAQSLGLRGFPTGVAYYTGDRPCFSRLGHSFLVRASLPLDERRIRRWLQEHDATIREVKKRGVAIDPASWRKRLTFPHAYAYELVVIPVGARILAVIAERCERP